MTHRSIVKWTGGLIVGAIFMGIVRADNVAVQIVPSATPAQISIPTPTALVTEDALPTPTWTATPTAIGVILLEALNEANVRAEPDVNSEQLGTIRAGETYPIIGRSFRWLQFRYDNAHVEQPTIAAFLAENCFEAPLVCPSVLLKQFYLVRLHDFFYFIYRLNNNFRYIHRGPQRVI